MAVFTNKDGPKSALLNKSFNYRLAALFGWRPIDKKKATTDFEKHTGMQFVKVDVGNPVYRTKQAALGNVFDNSKLSSTLDHLFNNYLNETTIVYTDIQERQERLSELRFAVTNSPYLSRACRLCADEATMMDDQNRILTVESPSVAFSNRCYELFAQWGLTQQRISATCFEIEQYGEAVWANKVTRNGVEKIVPLKAPELVERLEFSPVHQAEVEEQLANGTDMNKSRKQKIDKLLAMFKDKDMLNAMNDDFADMYDTKLLGYEFHDGIIAPPWDVTHFRYNADCSEFFPYGTPPLLFCLGPFKRAFSLWTLQGLARAASFPVQLYTVKGTEGVGVETAFETVNNVREEYDNIGVTPSSNSIEVYTVNTKIWAPEGLLDLKILESKVDYNFTDDIELAEDQVAFAAGVPRGYLDPSKEAWGVSGIALTEQFKPFATHIYTIQSTFLQGLGELIRLHFAITGEFDYNTPFILSMRFPAEEMSDDRRNAKTASIELSQSIFELLQGALGLEDGEPLPEDVITDILSKYTFLDPTDIQRWTRLTAIAKAQAAADEESDSEGEDGGSDDGGFDMGGDDGGGDDGGFDLGGGDDGGDSGDDGGMEESSNLQRRYYLKTKKLLQEKVRAKKLLREKRLRDSYFASREDIYFHWLKENHLVEWKKPDGRYNEHAMLIPNMNKELYESVELFKNDADDVTGMTKLKEDEIEKELQKTLYS
jgi:hypothetical protein